MIQSSKNQLSILKNPHQGTKKRVLCVCSIGMLRSPTIAKYISEEFGYNTRACGTDTDYALIPISTALLHWADEIHCVLEEVGKVRTFLCEELLTTRVFTLNIPDEYTAFSDSLLWQIKSRYYDYEETV